MENYEGFNEKDRKTLEMKKTKKLQLNTFECQGARRQGDRGLETRRGHGWQKSMQKHMFC